MNKAVLAGFALWLGAVSFATPFVSAAEEGFYCEVMTVEGTATLTNETTEGKALEEGDLLTVDDLVKVGSSSYVDIAYDKDWNNVTRIEENSSIRIRSLDPVEVELEEGGVFAKLKALPKDSSFDVQTPTAIASVRGTEYRTTYAGGETQIFNASDSDVYVYGLDEAGERQAAAPVVVRRSQVSQVPRRGSPPMAPRAMQPHEVQRVQQFQQGIDKNVRRNMDIGRTGKMRDAGAIEKFKQNLRERRANGDVSARPGSGEKTRKPLVSGDGLERRGPEDVQEGIQKEDRPERTRERVREMDENTEPSNRGGLAEPFFPGGERKRQIEPAEQRRPGQHAQEQGRAEGQQPQKQRPAARPAQPRQRQN